MSDIGTMIENHYFDMISILARRKLTWNKALLSFHTCSLTALDERYDIREESKHIIRTVLETYIK